MMMMMMVHTCDDKELNLNVTSYISISTQSTWIATPRCQNVDLGDLMITKMFKSNIQLQIEESVTNEDKICNAKEQYLAAVLNMLVTDRSSIRFTHDK